MKRFRLSQSLMGSATGVLVAGALLFSAASGAQAAFIEGTIGFGGQWLPLDGLGNPTTILNATQVDVVNNQAIVTAVTGDFLSSITLFSLADYNDFSFDPFAPATPLWSVPQGVGTFSFDLLSVSVDVQTADTLGLVGTGVIRGGGFSDTPGRYSFTGDGNGGTFTFSNSTATPIPEPASLGLFGIGLLGLGLLWRRRRGHAVEAQKRDFRLGGTGRRSPLRVCSGGA